MLNNKGDIADLSNFRPISLLSCFFKNIGKNSEKMCVEFFK